jgi:SAM-dependent methyltransferase
MSVAATPYHQGKKLEEADLMAPTGACPGCGRRGVRKVVLVVQRDPDVAFLRCGYCGLASASRMPGPEALDAYYASYYRPGDISYTFEGAPRFGRHLATFAPATRPLRILDFGGGDGSIAIELARAAGGEATISVVDRVPPRNDSPFAITRFDQLSEVDVAYDYIVASAILEHVPDLAPVMRALFERLAPGGVLYARTPWVVPLAKFAPSFDVGYPGHVHDIGPEFFARVPELFAPDVEIAVSQPSIVETTFGTHPLRTAFAWAMKTPSWIESRMRKRNGERSWKWVGGWEVVMRRP